MNDFEWKQWLEPAKIIKMEAGTFAWLEAGIVHELDNWQYFNCEIEEWGSARDYCMFNFPELGSFNEKLENYAKSLPKEATIYAYDSNESFGILRPCPDLQNGKSVLK